MMVIRYPYIPVGRAMLYVGEDNIFMQAARDVALQYSLDKKQKVGAVIVCDQVLVGRGVNGCDYHEHHGCERMRLGIPTGQGYDLCEGCHPKNHAERTAITHAQANGHDMRGAAMYLWGHWWACEPCWDAIISAGITHLYLLEKSEILFNPADKGTIIGR